jgi:hypothetical protein
VWTKVQKFFEKKANRAYLYTMCLAVIGLLVGYGVLDPEIVPLWITAITALLSVGPTLALKNLTPDKEDSDVPTD